MSGFSTQEVSDLVGLKPHQVRHYVRRELLSPQRDERGDYRFSFQDVSLLRTAKTLLDAEVSSRKAYKVLLKLKGELEHAGPLSAVKLYANGARVVRRDENALWDAESGQGQIDFTITEPAAEVAKLTHRNLIIAKEADALDSDEWYNLGLDLEEVDPERAPDAYRKALELDPHNADAHVNLGRLHQLKGDLKRAKRHYELAILGAPNHQLAHYNLGTLFDELDEVEQASAFYLKAPDVPDAHYNLSRIYELRGDELSALRHMREYRQMLDD